jgi:hypothetical protein
MQRLVAESRERCTTDAFNQPIIASTALLAVVSNKNYHPYEELEGDDRPKARNLQKLFTEMFPTMENMWLSAFEDTPLFTQTYAEYKQVFGYK